MSKILETYLNRLINISGSNRSILLLKPSKSQDIDFVDFDFSLNISAFELLKNLIETHQNIPLCKMLDARDSSSNNLSVRLKSLQRRDHFLFEERGSKDLYLAWPFVEGKFMDGTPVRCPLAFFPVEIAADSKNNWILKKRKDVQSSLNKSFLLAYSYFNKVNPDDELFNLSLEDLDPDFTVFRTELYQILKNSSVELNFNQELFADKLNSLKTYTKSDYEKIYENGILKLENNAVLGIFPQNSSYLFPDYQKLISDNLFTDIKSLFDSKHLEIGDYKENLASRESSLYNAYPMDASQERALIQVKKGHSIVVQGPPGTGKSQLICNLVSDFISRGKKVLVVCQKRAALDVVHQRLKEKKVENFTALVHDFKDDRKNLYHQVALQCESIEDFQTKNNGLDTVVLERNFQQISNKITLICDEFDEFKNALFDSHECGVSVKELYMTSNPRADFIDLKSYYNHFVIPNLDGFVDKIKNYFLYAEKFENENYPLKNRLSFSGFNTSDLKIFENLISEIKEVQKNYTEKISKLLVESIDLEESVWVKERQNIFYELLDDLQEKEIFERFKHYLNVQTDLVRFSQISKLITENYDNENPELSIKNNELGKATEVLQKAIKSRRNIFKKIGFGFSKDKYALQRILVSNKLSFKREHLKKLEQLIDARLNLEHNFSTLSALGWVKDVPDEREPKAVKVWISSTLNALQAKEKYFKLRAFKEFFTFQSIDYEQFKEKVNALFENIDALIEQKNKWNKHYNDYQISKILNQPDFAEKTFDALRKDFESLCEFDKIVESFSETEKTVLEKLLDKTGFNENELVSLFQNSIRLAWVTHIEDKYPVLRKVSTKRFEQLERELQSAIEEKLEISGEILLLKVRENTYKNVEYNRLKNLVTYRQLEKQVSKKRKIWTIRKLVNQCREELFDVVPCWLTSPETASAIFPLEPIFDLVIFDEASQCFAENAIPAIYRGNQFVVVGDDKQLSPNDLYTARWDSDNEEDSLELDAESVLDLANLYLKQYRLKHHYRSQSLELIDFSNIHFYNSGLTVLPHFKEFKKDEKTIEYKLVKGEWEKNQNIIEAQEVVNILFDLIKNKIEDIGIISFNYKQQELIQDLIEEESIKQKIFVPEKVFVKNIENVQGDERDIIVFSIGYAPTKSGKLNINFGSLNMQKGENRLNVAITRARKKIFIISSFLPHELKTDNTKNEGPKLFKAYLEYAWEISNNEYKPTPYKTESTLNKDLFLKNKLTEKHPNYLLELPFADITVKENNEYKMLILTDDDTYFKQLSAKESHAYLPSFLKAKKWKFTKLYSRQWWEGSEFI